MPIQIIKNQYSGINPHLHSYLLDIGNWSSLHSNYIHDLTRAMNRQLLPLGYTADVEQSLQIRREDEIHIPESDVTIYDTDPKRANVPFVRGNEATAYELVLPLPKVLPLIEEDERFFKAVGIYKPGEGKPVAWVELLSPSNKHGTTYRHKRWELLSSGIVFVEIDFLHDSPPTILGIASYSGKNANPAAHPYRMIVFDARPTWDEGQTYIRQFNVDEAIPIITIPLSGADKFTFDFNAPYQKMFEEMSYGTKFDYAQLPVNFDQYSPADQLRILKRMLTVIDAAQQGQHLEAVALLPIAYPDISLEDALIRVQQ